MRRLFSLLSCAVLAATLLPAGAVATAATTLLPTRIINTTVNPTQPYRNQSATVTGELEYQDANGIWQPKASTQVFVVPLGADPSNYVNLTNNWPETAADGTFSITEEDVPATGGWTITFDPSLTPLGPVSTSSPYAKSTATAMVADPTHLMYQSGFEVLSDSSPCVWEVQGRPDNLVGVLWGAPVGAPIAVQSSSDDKHWTTTTITGTNGNVSRPYETFSIPFKPTKTGYWRTTYAGSSQVLPSVSAPTLVTVGPEYRIDITSDQNGRPTPGSEIDLVGTAYGCSTTGYVLAAKGGAVDLQFSTNRAQWKTISKVKVSTADTGAFGGFVTANATGYWRAYVAQFKAAGPPILVTVRRDTRLTRLALTPRRIRRGSAIHLGGLLQGRGGSWYGLGNRSIRVLFRPTGSHTTTQIGTATTKASGTFAFTATAHQSGSWWISYPGSGQYYAVTSRSFAVVVT